MTEQVSVRGDQGERPSFRRLAVACGVGTSLEYYDFFVYGTASALVFGTLFFRAQDPLVATILAFSTFAVGFLVRPLGAIVFGHFGDRLGRRRMLVLSLGLMGVTTALMGLLPTYAAIGVAAPLILVLLRVVHGFSVGGEAGGAALMAVEHAPPGKRGLYGSLVTIGSPMGAFLANGSFALVMLLPPEDVLSWGWRVPFLAGVLVVLVGVFARRKLHETPVFQDLTEKKATERMPLMTVLRKEGKQVLLTAGVNLGFNAFVFILFVFLLTYGKEALKLPSWVMLVATLVGCLAQVVSIIGFCALTDRIGRKPVMLAGAVFCVVFPFPLFWMVNTAQTGLIILAITLGFVGSAAIFGPMLSYFSELFGAAHRYTGVGIGYQLGAVLGGGFSPLIATALLKGGGGSTAVATYVAAAALISVGCLLALPETVRREQPE
ncbi:MHS family MFS transporter [Allokutzneria sp. A3M-2-11 16]|uniref:MFS transporter n=1 Tax=Allokutzneria sp. A3M-2-11 16 TaxID=2962043 RepID=UPI0020B79558|nr:MFS transporter [Allokutzneria sp. A3M-2-11 16]MCP3799200.1 MHS family MFS transporter [Allokutzneria sp. A3M-2-11 16]